jgi:hypothetical protein
VASDDEAVAAIISLPAKNAHASIFVTGYEAPSRIGSFSAGVFHELEAGDAEALGCEAIHFTHFGGGESFHGVFTAG